MKKWHQLYDGDWGGWRLNRRVYAACCGCGLVEGHIYRVYPRRGKFKMLSSRDFILVAKGWVDRKKTGEWKREKKRREKTG